MTCKGCSGESRSGAKPHGVVSDGDRLLRPSITPRNVYVSSSIGSRIVPPLLGSGVGLAHHLRPGSMQREVSRSMVRPDKVGMPAATRSPPRSGLVSVEQRVTEFWQGGFAPSGHQEVPCPGVSGPITVAPSSPIRMSVSPPNRYSTAALATQAAEAEATAQCNAIATIIVGNYRCADHYCGYARGGLMKGEQLYYPVKCGAPRIEVTDSDIRCSSGASQVVTKPPMTPRIDNPYLPNWQWIGWAVCEMSSFSYVVRCECLGSARPI